MGSAPSSSELDIIWGQAYVDELAAMYEKRCRQTLSEWSAGVGNRSTTARAVHDELVNLADGAEAIDEEESVQRLTLVAGQVLAMGCRLHDEDFETAHDPMLIDLGVDNFLLRMDKEKFRARTMASSVRAERWTALRRRLRFSAAELIEVYDSYEEPDFEVADCAASAAGLLCAEGHVRAWEATLRLRNLA